jgi:hypothetical protein
MSGPWRKDVNTRLYEREYLVCISCKAIDLEELVVEELFRIVDGIDDVA